MKSKKIKKGEKRVKGKKASFISRMMKKLNLRGIKISLLIPIVGIIVVMLIAISMGITRNIKSQFSQLNNEMNDQTKKLSENVNEGFSTLSSEIKKKEIERLDEQLIDLKSSGMGYFEYKMETLTQKGTLVTKMNKTINLVGYQLREKDMAKLQKGVPDQTVEYSHVTGKILYTLLLNQVKDDAWSGNDRNIGLDVFGPDAEIIASSSFTYKLERGDTEKELIKTLLDKGYLQSLFNVTSSDHGVFLKIYLPIMNHMKSKVGGMIINYPLKDGFVEQLQRFTKSDIMIFNGGEGYISSMRNSDGKIFTMDAKEEFQKLSNNPGATVYKEFDHEFKGETNNYKMTFSPLPDYQGNVVGMVGYALPTDELDVSIKQIEDEQATIMSKFQEQKDLLINTLEENRLEMFKSNFKMLLIVSIVSLILAVALIYFVVSHIVKFINKILSVVRSVGDADLTKKIEHKSKNELGELADGINNMVDNLKDILTVISKSSLDNISSIEEISQISSNNQASMDGFVDTFKGVNRDLKAQEEMVMDVKGSLEEMGIAANNISESSTEVNQYTYDTQKITDEGMESVEDAIEAMKEIKEGVVGIKEVEKALIEKLNSIENFVQTINSISEQTTLLSLNASIEAARAGDAGKGFAVVANEIKKLAEGSSQATKDITEMVNSLKEEANKVNDEIDKGVDKTDKGVEITLEAGEALEKVLKSVNSINDMMSNITAATEEQSATTSGAVEQVDNLLNTSKEMNNVITDLSNESTEILEVTQEIDTGLINISENITEQQNLVDEFKTEENKARKNKGIREKKNNGNKKS
ncbi:MAG: methyl-accepting chemotaxis protein [Fusobacteriota bacterium]